MSIQELGSIGEFIAALATLATLAFLALQIRQSNRAARNQAEIELPQRFAEWVSRVSAHPEQMRVWDLAAAAPDRLTDEEIRQFRWTVAEVFLVFESQYFAYKGGVLSLESWHVKRGTLLGFLENPILAEWWARRMTPFSEEFRQEIEAHRDKDAITWNHEEVGALRRTAAGTPE